MGTTDSPASLETATETTAPPPARAVPTVAAGVDVVDLDDDPERADNLLA